MENVENPDREGLVARMNALRLAAQALREGKTDAVDAVHRISRSLRVSEGASCSPEIKALASRLEGASKKELLSNLPKDLARLRDIVAHLEAKPFAVLIVDDDPVTAHILQQRLHASNRDIFIARTIEEAEFVLSEHEVSLALLDLQLPDGDGRELLMRLRRRSSTSALPVLILSAKRGSQIQTECYAMGADGYFEKPFDPVTIATVVASKLEREADASQRSTQDPLTKLPNRTAFVNAFRRAAMLAERSNAPLTVAILDVDRFKSVNDIYGHPMGDRVLRRLATVVSRSLRASDLFARWGGEEFAFFFPDTSLTKARLALDKALDAFRNERFTTRDGRSFQVTFSAGVAQVKPRATVEEAIADADRFLYLAKAIGRDHVLTERDQVASLKKNILLVEDDAFTASVIKRYLLRDGFKVIHAKDGNEALSMAGARNASISLITLDVNVPGLDGFELLRRFRKMPSLHQTPIVMLTSAGRQEDIVKGFQLGADDYILKPFSPREMLARVRRFLQKD